MTSVSATALLALIVTACAPAGAHVDPIAPRADDVATVDGIMLAFYAVVNVPPDAPRQWGRDRTLYAPWIRFVGIGRQRDVWSHQQLVDATEPLIREGFHEREINRRTRSYGNIVHIDSTYETLLGAGGAPRHERGVNSVELYFDGARWWIASVMWQSETAEHPIPPELLP